MTAARTDQHPADVKAALEKRGISLKNLSIEHGYERSAAGKALRQSWPAMERIIARALDVHPSEIWPSRYDADGRPLRERRRAEGSTVRTRRNVQKERAA